MATAKGAAPDRNSCSINTATILHPSDGRIPVGELSFDRQELAGLAAAVAEVPIGEGQGSDTGLCEPLGECIQTHLAGGAEAVPEDDHGRRSDAGGRVKPCGAGVIAGRERKILTCIRLRSV